ncbi:MAG: UpxY family transcription antiterminator [Bacteroidales bacterium]|nr:UpxY family transcription antiterminator [Bacteroidales bacterium]
MPEESSNSFKAPKVPAAASKAPAAPKSPKSRAASPGSRLSAGARAVSPKSSAVSPKSNAALTKVTWYPVRVLFGKINLVKRTLDEGDVEYFYPTHIIEKNMKYIEEPLVRSLIFIKTTPVGLREIKARYSTSLIPYYDYSRDDGTKPPVTVPEAQMEMFIKLCHMKEAGLEYLGEDEPKYHLGDRVRVTDGIFKGFEGHIKRIRHDRKLIVTIEGVAAFATRFIPPSMLEKVE